MCFNEARALSTGKTALGCTILLDFPCFNEARALSTGKMVRDADIMAAGVASMRPAH